MMTLVWFGSDLRLADNPALDAAVADGRAVVPFYVLDDADAGGGRQVARRAGGCTVRLRRLRPP